MLKVASDWQQIGNPATSRFLLFTTNVLFTNSKRFSIWERYSLLFQFKVYNNFDLQSLGAIWILKCQTVCKHYASFEKTL